MHVVSKIEWLSAKYISYILDGAMKRKTISHLIPKY